MNDDYERNDHFVPFVMASDPSVIRDEPREARPPGQLRKSSHGEQTPTAIKARKARRKGQLRELYKGSYTGGRIARLRLSTGYQSPTAANLSRIEVTVEDLCEQEKEERN